jgi:uncharacterized protein (DUF488 family)
MTDKLFTIGYASFSIKDFVSTLQQHRINALVDVRSAPYSKYNPEFKKDNLHKVLADNNSSYIFLGKYVGARIEDPACYIDGKLNYGLLNKTKNYQTGINRILNGMKDYRIALMCAEKDPAHCHRTFLVCRTLRSYPIKILHILEDGSLEEHPDTEERLLKLHGLDQEDIFRSEKDRVNEVYDRMCVEITFNSK